MTIHNFKCVQCGAANEKDIIDDVHDIPEDDYKRVKKLVDWEYSSQAYEQYWDDDTFLDGQMISRYQEMLEDPEFASGVRIFFDHIYGERLMSEAMDIIKREKYPTWYQSERQIIAKAVELYKDRTPNFMRPITTKRINK